MLRTNIIENMTECTGPLSVLLVRPVALVINKVHPKVEVLLQYFKQLSVKAIWKTVNLGLLLIAVNLKLAKYTPLQQ